MGYDVHMLPLALALLWRRGSTRRRWPGSLEAALADLHTVVGTVNQVVTSAALVVGGGWAYLKFVRGRVYAQRVTVNVEAMTSAHASGRLLIVRTSVTNVGLSKLSLKPDGKVVYVCAARGWPEGEAGSLTWERLLVTPVMAHHGWLEPQESVADETAVSLPVQWEPWLALRIEAQVWASRRRWRRYGKRWVGSVTVPLAVWTSPEIETKDER